MMVTVVEAEAPAARPLQQVLCVRSGASANGYEMLVLRAGNALRPARINDNYRTARPGVFTSGNS